jgi:hypothetical protein
VSEKVQYLVSHLFTRCTGTTGAMAPAFLPATLLAAALRSCMDACILKIDKMRVGRGKDRSRRSTDNLVRVGGSDVIGNQVVNSDDRTSELCSALEYVV